MSFVLGFLIGFVIGLVYSELKHWGDTWDENH